LNLPRATGSSPVCCIPPLHGADTLPFKAAKSADRIVEEEADKEEQHF